MPFRAFCPSLRGKGPAPFPRLLLKMDPDLIITLDARIQYKLSHHLLFLNSYSLLTSKVPKQPVPLSSPSTQRCEILFPLFQSNICESKKHFATQVLIKKYIYLLCISYHNKYIHVTSNDLYREDRRNNNKKSILKDDREGWGGNLNMRWMRRE